MSDELLFKPRETLQTICGFLSVSCEEHYLARVERILYKKPSDTRNTVVWTKEQKDRVHTEMQKYSFLRQFTFNWNNIRLFSSSSLVQLLGSKIPLSIGIQIRVLRQLIRNPVPGVWNSQRAQLLHCLASITCKIHSGHFLALDWFGLCFIQLTCWRQTAVSC